MIPMPRKTPLRPTLNGARRQDDAPATLPDTLDTRLVGARLVPIDQVVPDPDQPRRNWDDEESVARLEELAASLKEFGVLQPLLVRKDGSLDDGRTRYMIIAGGRRRAAAEIGGLLTLPVVVRDEEAGHIRVLQLIENIQRRALAPLDEARAYQEIIDADGISAEALGDRLGISGQQVRDRILLLSDQVVSDAVQREQVPATVASEMLRLPDEGQRLLRERIESGEVLERSDIRKTRASLTAAGVKNPRAKGGGRARKDQSGFDRAEIPKDQSRFDPDPVQGLYEAFKDWEAHVSQLAPHDLQRLLGLIRGDMQKFIAIVTEMTSNERDGAIEVEPTGDTL